MAFEPMVNGSTVYVKNDNVEQALRKLKKRLQDNGMLQDLRDREFYEKPTAARKKKAAAAKQRWKKKLSSQQLPKKLF
jgi:small subunit ribosomal protein S21